MSTFEDMRATNAVFPYVDVGAANLYHAHAAHADARGVRTRRRFGETGVHFASPFVDKV